jgi:hypothetical protein
MPRMRSASACADRNGVRDRNAQRRHDDRICDPRQERLNSARVGFLVEPIGETRWLPSLFREGVSPLSFCPASLRAGGT